MIFTTWVQGRRGPLQVYGPEGTEDMTSHIMSAWKADIEIRTQGMEHRSMAGLTVEAHDVKPGVVYEDPNVKVTAFQNAHGEWRQTFGYQFKTADRTIVISGDTNPSAALVAHCRQCDLLIHEVYADEYRPANVPNWLEYRSRYHTTTTELAEIANKTRPGLLILYHRGVGPRGRQIADARYLEEIGRTYRGQGWSWGTTSMSTDRCPQTARIASRHAVIWRGARPVLNADGSLSLRDRPKPSAGDECLIRG